MSIYLTINDLTLIPDDVRFIAPFSFTKLALEEIGKEKKEVKHSIEGCKVFVDKEYYLEGILPDSVHEQFFNHLPYVFANISGYWINPKRVSCIRDIIIKRTIVENETLKEPLKLTEGGSRTIPAVEIDCGELLTIENVSSADVVRVLEAALYFKNTTK